MEYNEQVSNHKYITAQGGSHHNMSCTSAMVILRKFDPVHQSCTLVYASVYKKSRDQEKGQIKRSNVYFDDQNSLIAIAGGSTGHIVVTTPCSTRVKPSLTGQTSFCPTLKEKRVWALWPGFCDGRWNARGTNQIADL